MDSVLPQTFYLQDTVTVARLLLGCLLVHSSASGRATGRIVETEAYVTGDEASHGFRGPSRRNAAMFGPAGHAYIYFIYGAHYCLNTVTAPAGTAEAVLIRALEPVEGLELMAARRGVNRARDLCSGPGKLAQALSVTAALDGVPLYAGALHIRAGVAAGPIVATTRIGISKAADLPLRFYLSDNPYVSKR